jgi:hypothetical protein
MTAEVVTTRRGGGDDCRGGGYDRRRRWRRVEATVDPEATNSRWVKRRTKTQ